jgi:CBS domain-containing protein
VSIMKGSTISSLDIDTLLGKLTKLKVGRPQVEGGLIYASPEQELRHIVPRMVEHDLDEIPVLSGKRVMGVLSIKSVVKRRNLPPSTKVQAVMLSPPELTPESSAIDLANAIVSSGFREIPVVENGRLAGIADRTLLVRLISDISELRKIDVSEIMTPSVITLREEDYIDRAFETIRSTGIRSVPVVDREGKMTSLLTLSDLARLGMRGKQRETFGEIVGSANPVEITVGSIAGKNFEYVVPGDTSEKLFRIMVRDDVRSVPVLREGVPVGIITKYDIAQLVNSLKAEDSVFVQITGLDDTDLREELFEDVGKSMRRIDRISRPLAIYIHVHTYNSEFGRIKYSFSARLQTVDRLYVAKSFDWDARKGVQEMLSKLERMVKETKSMRVERRKRSSRAEA